MPKHVLNTPLDAAFVTYLAKQVSANFSVNQQFSPEIKSKKNYQVLITALSKVSGRGTKPKILLKRFSDTESGSISILIRRGTVIMITYTWRMIGMNMSSGRSTDLCIASNARNLEEVYL